MEGENKNIQDIKIKTELCAVQLMLYEDMAELIGIKEKSRERIDKIKQIAATERYSEIISVMQSIIDNHTVLCKTRQGNKGGGDGGGAAEEGGGGGAALPPMNE